MRPDMAIKPLTQAEKSEIAARLRGDESVIDIAFDLRVPPAWVGRILTAIERSEEKRAREKRKRDQVRALKRRQIQAPPIAPKMPAPERASMADLLRVPSVKSAGNDNGGKR